MKVDNYYPTEYSLIDKSKINELKYIKGEHSYEDNDRDIKK